MLASNLDEFGSRAQLADMPLALLCSSVAAHFERQGVVLFERRKVGKHRLYVDVMSIA